ncbi:MAG TPA: M56 family metallopeptidase [Sphingomicrobium sp.]|nr:M56 family metallopeptidase [Sphingomicrobium sp.]
MTDWLLGTLLATSGLFVLVLLIREPVRRHFGARVAYGLWLIPAARLLMPTITMTVERTVTAPAPSPHFVPEVSIEPMLLATIAAPEPTLIEQLGGWPTILLILWLGGALGLFAARMLAFHRERGAILANAIELGRFGSIRLVRSPVVNGPLAFGIFDRVIAVPADFDNFYAPHERRLALDHELAHHRSGDLVANFFAFVLLCLQWFNPLAWVAHAAFRFDQEAACDARVLDKVKADDRADYGRAIAKAASGRALLFASALDRRNTLHRRLKSMLTNPTAGRRLSGRLMVLATVAVVLPLTATRAINYIDVPATAEAETPAVLAASAVQAVPAVQPVQAQAPVAPAAPTDPLGPSQIDRNGKIMINGQEKQWRDLTPAEKAEVRRSIAEAREELARTRIDRAEIQREVREAMEEAKIDKEELRREMAEARAEIEEAMREIDAHAAEIRRSGQDPEQIKATIRASLKAVEAIDVEAITRSALASVDHKAIEASVAAAEASMAKAQADIERLERQFEED